MMAMLSLAGCGIGGSGADADGSALPIPTAQAAPAPLHLRLELPARVRAGQPVPIRLVLQNRGDVPVEVGLGGSPIAFDVLILTSGGVMVWRRLEGVAVEAILQPRTLAPGQEMAFEHQWDQRNDRERRVTPGGYQVRGILPVVGYTGGWATDTHSIIILP